jgi:hypothetical protein
MHTLISYKINSTSTTKIKYIRLLIEDRTFFVCAGLFSPKKKSSVDIDY